jgi:hypothetical protein
MMDCSVSAAVMAWNHWTPTRAALERMRDCSITVAGFVPMETLDVVHEVGLKAIVADKRLSGHDWRKPDEAAIRRGVREAVAAVGEHPAAIGFYIQDEPCADEFAGLAIAADEVRCAAPHHWPYINLFPDYASAAQLGTATYEDHLERFIAACRPPLLSYDNYSIMEAQDVRPPYWTNLASVREASLRYEIPFWNIVLTVAHFHYRELTAADARFQAYTSLAYGARGLAYFTYFSPAHGNYRMGPIDQFGNETPTWGMLRNVNLQLARVGPVMAKLKSQRVYHFGDVPRGCRGSSGESFVEGLAGTKQASACVGDFLDEAGERYAMIVNTDFRGSLLLQPVLRGVAKDAVAQVLSPYSGRWAPFAGEQGFLAPGQGALLKLWD